MLTGGDVEGETMAMRLIPNAAAMSEFVAGYKGACGETAEVCVLHVINPVRYPLNAAELASVVKRDIDHQWAGANGAEPLSAIANDLALEGIKHTSYGFSQPPRFDWRAVLHQWGGVKPLIFEYALASRLPGDEAGVHYHFNACLGWDPDANVGVFADGDNLVVRNGESGAAGLVRYTLADLEAAQVCGLLVAEYVLGSAPAVNPAVIVPKGWKDDGATLTAPNGAPVVRGFRDYILRRPAPWPDWNWPLGPEAALAQLELGNPALGGGSQQVFRATVLEWRPTSASTDAGPVGVFEMWVGQELAATREALSAATSQASASAATIASLQTQIASLQTQLPDQQAGN
jgi:hypothetical protein